MFNDRICKIHNLPSTAIDLKAYKDENEGFLCAKCLTDQNNSDEIAHLYDIQSTIDDIVGSQISKQQQFTHHLISQLEELKNHLSQFQQSLNIIINKQIKNIEQDQKELTQKLNHLENQENVRNDSFYLEFIKKNYKGKYVLQCSNKLDQENTNLMKNIKEGIDQIIKSEQKIKIYEQLNQIINECNQEEIITKIITQKINQKQKTIKLSQDCPIHEQETTMIVLDKKCDRNRLICIDCIEECQQQGLKKFYSIKKVNQMWKDSKEKLSQSLSQILNKSQLNVKKAQEILQQQNNKFNESTEQLQLLIGQSINEIKSQAKKVDEEKHINLQELESQELLNFIILLADGSYETELVQIERLQEQEQKQFINRVKEHSKVLKQLKNEYDQQIQSEYGFYKIEEQEPIDIKIDIFNDIKQCQQYFIKQHNLNQNLKIANITLEDCNNVIVDDKEYKNQIINKWLKDSQDNENFKLFALILVDQIKRQRLSIFISEIMSLNKNLQFNAKQLFYLIFINSSEELKFQLLKNQIIKQSVPLIYQNPNLTQINSIQDFFLLNKSIFYLFPECYPIINLSLSKVHSSFGKTQVINQIFYKQEIFEVNDQCESNLHSIDIMFDFCFSGSRNLAIADVHGIIPIQVMIKILPLFKFCIIQMNSEDELKENYEQFMHIKQNLQKWNPECCFIIRNSKAKDNKQLSQLEIDIEDQGISIHKMIDLTQKNLYGQQINSEMESFSQFIFGKIKEQKSKLFNSQDFLIVLQKYYGQNDSEIEQIQKENQLLESLMNELKNIINNQQGFFSQQAFPIRALMWEIKYLKQQQHQFDGLTMEEQIKYIQSIVQKIKELEKEITNTKPTQILELFQQILSSHNYYNLYLKFTYQLEKFNKINSFQLSVENQILKDDLQKKQQQQNQIQSVTDINEQIIPIKNKLDNNLKTIEFRNIGIELFWRELIQIKQKGQSAQLKINPAKIIADMVKKGEPFEFLDGDQLEIDTKFLLEFIKNFPEPDKNKVLVLSILGPQSSGKSTVLNKMFGSHFYTGFGRCIIGINFQLLKISQKSYFDNQFDYILIFDTEGLLNPNKNDPEFDKKIALFILAISDIILINVKGDIHSSFKNLVEMCIFTLGQMKNSLKSVKQLNWCFNQNNDCKNFAPFLDQIQGIVNNLNLQINNTEDESDNSNFDYNEVLNIKNENIKILGFASTDQSWRVNSNTGIYDEWRQLIVNEIFSEEAQIFGVQMIKQFVEKLKTQQGNSLQSLQLIVQKVESNWQNICRLPDLLEFTEVLQYRQVQLKKKKYEELLAKELFNYETKIQRKIEDQVFAKKQNDLEFFKSMEKNEKYQISNKKAQMKQNFANELQKQQTEKKFQNKIYNKYFNLLEDYLQIFEYNCHIILLDKIKQLEIEYQQREGLTYIEDLFKQSTQNVEKFKDLIINKESVQKMFDSIWTQFESEAIEQQEQVFLDYSQAQYKAIYSFFTQYQYNSENSEQFKIFFFEMSKTPPIQQNYDEKQIIFNKYIQEIQSKQQFQIIFNNNQNRKYQDIFCQPLSETLKMSDTSYIVDFNGFYCSNCSIFYYISSGAFKQYLISDSFYDDFNQFYNQQKQKYYPNIWEFICILDYCQISYQKKQLDKLEQYLITGNKWYEFGDKTKSYFKDFQKTFGLNQIINQVIMKPEFTKNIQYYYPSIQFKYIKFHYNNDQDYQRQLEKYNLYVLFLLNHKVKSKQQEHFESFSCIADIKGDYCLLEKFKSQIIYQFSKIMIECEGWQRIYSEIYDIIQQKMRTIQNQMDKQKVEFDFENIEALTSNNYLVKQIMKIIEQKILEYNKQFANFGIILSSIGERLIYYYSIFIIWRLLCHSKWKQLNENLQQLKQMQNEQQNRFAIAIVQYMNKNLNQISERNYHKINY